jgi:hypothetical protein
MVALTSASGCTLLLRQGWVAQCKYAVAILLFSPRFFYKLPVIRRVINNASLFIFLVLLLSATYYVTLICRRP